MKINDIENKEYKIPLNVSKLYVRKYTYVIESGYAKYLYSIAICGGGCMLSQFVELLRVMDKDVHITYSGYFKRARIMIEELEGLGFIETNYLNRNKYIILKHPAVALSEGDYKTYKRVSAKELFKSDKFTNSITKMQGLLDYGFVYEYSSTMDQLIDITKQIHATILKNGNRKGYDTSLMKEIINVSDHKRIASMLDDKPEHKNKLGPVRIIWSDLASLFRKIHLKSCLISSEPLYLKVFSQDDGLVTLHYVPAVVIYDTMKSTEFYDAQNTFLSNGFYGIRDNNTLGMKDEYIKSGTLGFEHFNRIGYTNILIGSNEAALMKKKQILNEPFDNGGIHSPMVEPSECYVVDIERYINHSSITNGENSVYDGAIDNIEKTIGRLVSSVNE